MAFIAVNAKADIVTEGTSPSATTKKGKLTPAQNAQVNAWTLSKKTGILNTLDKCEATVSTPIDNKVIVTFKRGYFVVCGRLVEVEAGTEIRISLPTSGTVEGNIVARFNLAYSQENEFQVLATTGSIVKQNLNVNTSGRYDFVLYGYTAKSDGVELIPREADIYVDSVSNTLDYLLLAEKGLGEGSNIPLVSKIAQYASKDYSKGTIEERLTKLGFNTGSVTLKSGTATPLLEVSQSQNKVQLARQGNYVIGHFEVKSANIGVNNTVFTLPDGFKPRKTVSFLVGAISTGQGVDFYDAVTLTINTNGTAVFSGTIRGYYIKSYKINFGFET